jgi:hypothetical protein
MNGVSLDLNIRSTANLLAAALDLDLVKLLRDAIRTADLSGAAAAGGGGKLATTTPPCEHVIRPPVIEPRVHYHLEPYFEPRPVLYTAAPCCTGPRAVAPVVEVAIDSTSNNVPDCELPFQPPWKVLPWQNPPPVVLKMKPVVHRANESLKGKTLDLFI